MDGGSRLNVYPMHNLPGGLRKDPTTLKKAKVLLLKRICSVGLWPSKSQPCPSHNDSHLSLSKKHQFFLCKSELCMGDPNFLKKKALRKTIVKRLLLYIEPHPYKVGPYQLQVGSHNSTYRGEKSPVTHLVSAIYKGPHNSVYNYCRVARFVPQWR